MEEIKKTLREIQSQIRDQHNVSVDIADKMDDLEDKLSVAQYEFTETQKRLEGLMEIREKLAEMLGEPDEEKKEFVIEETEIVKDEEDKPRATGY